MSLYQDWQNTGSDFTHQNDYDAYWKKYFSKEKDVYQKLLAEKKHILEGSIKDLAHQNNLEPMEFVGFLDGINTSLTEAIELEPLTEESEIKAEIDFEKLLFNMHAAKAEWLYELPEWHAIFDEDKRKEIRKAYMQSKTIVKGEKIGRNDPCTCGSGKKYKKCCGK